MTIEIRQLVIRAIVEPSVGAERDGQTTRSAGTPAALKTGGSEALPPVDQDALVAACVREVLRALRRSRGR